MSVCVCVCGEMWVGVLRSLPRAGLEILFRYSPKSIIDSLCVFVRLPVSMCSYGSIICSVFARMDFIQSVSKYISDVWWYQRLSKSVYVSMYASICVSVWVLCICSCVYVQYLCVSLCMYLCVFVYLYMCVYVSMYVFVPVCVRICMYVHVPVYVYTCLCVCIHVCVGVHKSAYMSARACVLSACARTTTSRLGKRAECGWRESQLCGLEGS